MMNIMMKSRLLGFFLAAVSLLLGPAVAMAQDEQKIYDARLEGYGSNVTLPSSTTALMWLLLFVLTALCVGVMFKNARRTHLD